MTGFPPTPVPDTVLRKALDRVPVGWVEPEDRALTDAAVLAPWFTQDGRDHLLFTRRRDDLPHHPGQLSFPGGAREGDESPLGCALRESHEEIGLRPEDVEVLGALPPRVSVAGFWVQIVVGRIPPDYPVRPDPREVAAVCAFPVDLLREPGCWEQRELARRPGRRFPHFVHGGEVLWGLTARFTLDLLARLGRTSSPDQSGLNP